MNTMNDKRVDFRKLNDAKRGLMFRGLGIGVVLYWLIKDIVLPYLAGGGVGGFIGGLTFEKVPLRWLRVIFALFLLYGGVKYLL
jgi:uncharacterized membrane protein YfcA